MLGVGIFPKFNRRRKKASNVHLPIFSGRYGAWHLQRRAKLQEAKDNVFSARIFCHQNAKVSTGPPELPAGGQGSSRKHCAIAFRSAAKKPHWKLMWFFPKMCDFALQCWLGGDGGRFRVFLCLCSPLVFVVNPVYNMFKPRISLSPFSKTDKLQPRVQLVETLSPPFADGSWVGQKAAAVVAFLASMAGLVHLVLRALSPDPRLVFQGRKFKWRLEPKKVTEMDSY